jgi:hypothetical protein
MSGMMDWWQHCCMIRPICSIPDYYSKLTKIKIRATLCASLCVGVIRERLNVTLIE